MVRRRPVTFLDTLTLFTNFRFNTVRYSFCILKLFISVIIKYCSSSFSLHKAFLILCWLTKGFGPLILQKEISDVLFLSTYFAAFIISFEAEVKRIGLFKHFPYIRILCGRMCKRHWNATDWLKMGYETLTYCIKGSNIIRIANLLFIKRMKVWWREFTPIATRVFGEKKLNTKLEITKTRKYI